MADFNWLVDVPAIDDARLRALNRAIDDAYLSFTRSYGAAIEDAFLPLLRLMVWFEQVLLGAPWWLVVAIIAGLAWAASRSRVLVGLVVGSFVFIAVMGMWEDTMRTMAMISVCTLIAVVLGIPIGILMSRSDRLKAAIVPVLDVMQTMPSFVYLIPVVMLLGLGKVPGLLAVVIYAIPPVIRLTDLGIRLVDAEVLEATDAFGASPWQRLWGVQVPLALPNIMAGINQTIMMALSMVVVASMIGVKGLGQPVLRAVTNQYFAMGVLNGLAVVLLAIIFDRLTQSYGRRLQRYRDESR
ncbi:proline/glycine betaine ABC transporter permease [Roseospira marina]|uniref:Proline/glycine betaine ABC transporter permease n=1 Tax=Roseospira marina TaxID=140057 RepID=A0A5M6IBV2_9PROT|nr:proline/glycine betaine ABC transporter permease [Roseospira marina]KAA5605592.1 proline/glycine betaine ABC transporter permease [Roseospira marina]MBB4313341.1 glycine betaine/proline transport system permease protein [Roseospira marina]MBB5085918.1 glycine betaine/proline transport system permease protein [Roseospira marina]